MFEKDPSALTDAINYIWIIAVAIWGGVMRYVRSVVSDEKQFSFPEFLLEICTSAFFGIIVFWLCQSFGLNLHLTAALVGVAGHEGTRLIIYARRYFKVANHDDNR